MLDNMSPRERILAIAVGSLVPIFVLFYGFLWFLDRYDSNESEIDDLIAQVEVEAEKTELGKKAASRQGYYRKSSLPSRDRARSIYKTWLLDLVEKEAGMKVDAVRFKEAGKLVFERDTVASRGAVTIRPKGTLEQLVTLLHRFYSADHLHRINKLTIKPEAISKRGKPPVLTGQLNMEIEIETLSMVGGPKDLGSFPKWKRKLPAVNDYASRILDRNIFGPANNRPVLQKPGRLKFTIAKSAEDARGKYETIQISAKDADADDILSFELVEKSGSDNASAVVLGDQPRSSSVRKISLRVPKQFEPVTIPVTVRVTDDGLPAKEDELDFTIVFEKPTPSEPKTEKPKPVLVKDSTLTTIVGLMRGVDGRWVARLRLKSQVESKEMARGDVLELDGAEWEVVEVNRKMITFEVDGEKKSFGVNSTLAEPLKAL